MVLNGSLWQASTTNTYVGNFERRVTFAAVYRDTNSDIVSSGGTLDSGARFVTSSVSWSVRGATTTRSVSTYLTDIYGN